MSTKWHGYAGSSKRGRHCLSMSNSRWRHCVCNLDPLANDASVYSGSSRCGCSKHRDIALGTRYRPRKRKLKSVELEQMRNHFRPLLLEMLEYTQKNAQSRVRVCEISTAAQASSCQAGTKSYQPIQCDRRMTRCNVRRMPSKMSLRQALLRGR